MAQSNKTQGDAAFSQKIPSVFVVQFTVQISKLNGLGKTHRERILVVELKLKFRSIFHYEQIAWENSDIKMNESSIVQFNCNQIPHVLTFLVLFVND